MKVGLILATKFGTSYDYNSFVPLGIGYLAANINHELPDVQVVLKEQLEDLIAERPDLIGISSSTENYYIAIQWAKRIKRELNIPVIIGGVHISLLPVSLKKCFDLAVIGEGEITVVELLKSIVKNKGIAYEELANIPGLFFYHNSKPILTAPREIIEDLDSLPEPEKETLPFYRKSSVTHIFSARGCPYNCSFCASEKLFQKYRPFSSDKIIREIAYLINEKRIKSLVFYDDLLIANKKRLTEIVNKLEERRLDEKCEFSCQVRANLIDDDICKLLKRMNMVNVGIGLESFSDRILRYYNKSGVTSEVNQRALDLLSKYGIKVNPSFIFGAPIETKEDMAQTLRKIYINIEENKINDCGWGLLRPYPGTAIWNYAENAGIVSKDMDWERFSDWSNFELYLCEGVSKSEFVELTEEWFTKYSILRESNKSVGGNIYIRNRDHLFQSAVRLKKIIEERTEQGSRHEPGDERITNYLSNPIIYEKDGCYDDHHDGWLWTARKAEITLNAERKRKFFLLVSVPEFYESISILPMKVDIYEDNRKIVDRVIQSTGFSKIEISPLKKNKIINLRIECDKSFIPVEKGLNEDVRELSLLVKIVFE